MHFVRALRFDHNFPDTLLLSIPHQCSVFFLDALQDVRCACSPAAIRENGVAEGELGKSYFAATEECCRIWPKWRTNARRGRKLQHWFNAGVHTDAAGCAIF